MHRLKFSPLQLILLLVPLNLLKLSKNNKSYLKVSNGQFFGGYSALGKIKSESIGINQLSNMFINGNRCKIGHRVYVYFSLINFCLTLNMTAT